MKIAPALQMATSCTDGAWCLPHGLGGEDQFILLTAVTNAFLVYILNQPSLDVLL